ncbi:hypothetical protein PTSG_05637 [Salpingoeca rosetta]|uniref:Peptidase M24 domain-containing protein n=1 Tax=Salpingoeca rosetta (strain ATCC 50818 / BSB-021) TaxID=946362 RepID=F2UBS6_SALR5|nr:uncharacterized protein PTSG_05637 [Salpingoeca rosetta]EGD73942.1 hypothetical protein PTSG_05637 [Salpingoeca rosetta]|eukprot:XP_004993505.1 hypothetical protein PTSG_05637 [Salpingoeca rosetta]
MELDRQSKVVDADALSKYRAAAAIANDCVQQLVANCIAGADVYTLAVEADTYIEQKLKELKAGVEVGSLPTCLAVNNCTGYNSPIKAGEQMLKPGDIVKITTGCHVDGHIAVNGHTHVVGVLDKPMTGRQADVVVATHCAAEAVHRMLRPGLKSEAIPHMIETIASYFRCKPVATNYTCNMRRFVLEGDKIVLNGKSEDCPPPFVVEEDDVFNVDIMLSTGAGSVRDRGARPTVYQRDLNQRYDLRTRAARSLYSQVTARHPSMPFSIRGFALKDRLGLKDCLDHKLLLLPYDINYEREGEFVAQIKFTAIVKAEGTLRLCSHPPPYVRTIYEIKSKEVQELLQEDAPKEGPTTPLPVNCKPEEFQAVQAEE